MKIKDEFDYQVLNLTDAFFDAYSDPPYKEIARKKNRPYACLLIQSHYGYFIAIPYRSHINHKYAYRFKKSRRSQRARSGLDYSKAIIITNVDYIGAEDAIIDQDEYKETRDNIKYIRNDVVRYIDNYVDHLNGTRIVYDEIEFSRVYRFSTLPYFHKELGIATA
ncbi:MAG: hypothetical protein LUC98_11610 [Lachnospiraceae bacterium]|nr:hypothetical protein [Lachnospiraceae bacterium]